LVIKSASCEYRASEGGRANKGLERALEEHDKPAACCPKQAVRKIRKIDSENKNEDESGEKTEAEKALEENDDAPVVNVNNELIGGLRG
jgi:hypothetical protein